MPCARFFASARFWGLGGLAPLAAQRKKKNRQISRENIHWVSHFNYSLRTKLGEITKRNGCAVSKCSTECLKYLYDFERCRVQHPTTSASLRHAWLPPTKPSEKIIKRQQQPQQQPFQIEWHRFTFCNHCIQSHCVPLCQCYQWTFCFRMLFIWTFRICARHS